MQSWKVFPSALWSEVSRTRWGTWCKVKWARAWTLGGKLHACDSLDERARGETLHPAPTPPPPPPPPPPPHPPLNRWILQETKDAFMCLTGAGVSVRGWLIQAPSSWRRSCSDQSPSQPATLSQQRHVTRTRIARLTKTAPSVPWHLLRWCTISTSDFFLGHRSSVFLTGALSSVFLGVAAVPPPASLFVRVSALEWGLGAFEDLFL